MKKNAMTLTLVLLTGVLGLVGAGAASANDPTKDEKRTSDRNLNYPVTVGKVTMPASKVPIRETVHSASDRVSISMGRFVRQGKAVFWTTDPAEKQPTEATSKTESKGRFVQRGKAIIWVNE